ncbi:adenylate/guanylate cyclase domain-containing protein (plasmid) [Vibrio parahaemolyticus]|uniref:adenylate/guanylate cyclase domain-containing protein n=1 Tax=Vibrio TaxID=662 RepID=UPI00069860C1|nr:MULTISPECIES: adenylate/guanylate cyclase domain-containing protein [Vibrio]EJG0765825.1 adenylate/guanylate cyclase domain-containing protein [Vibrio parahaemolyticus O5:K30]TVN07129.1 adenylate/guanylate cyclase domain-containing protein [Vibrio cholerae]EGR2221116.1 adenylate/guanylate cyclase domain-containing protein [Vibrio parahaemolyticus]MBE4202732.1 adenylate/guanylate cyclase domain-containing protein [Vibrio parahaemolyticus]MCI4893930.1 adenylate/guanylate cyclase domain-contai
MKTNNTFSRHETGLVRVLGFIYLTIIFGSYYIEYESNLGNKFSPKIDILAMSIFFYLVVSYFLDYMLTPKIGDKFHRLLLFVDSVLCGLTFSHLKSDPLLVFMLLIIQSYIYISAGGLKYWFYYMTWSLFVALAAQGYNLLPEMDKTSTLMQWAGGFYSMIFIVIVSLQKHDRTNKLIAIREDLLKKGKKQKQLSKILSNYLSPQIVRMYEKGDDISTNLQRKKISVCFIDIVGFSSLSETLEPELLAIILNDFFSKMTEIALKHGGTVDKYIGDGMMVFFGDPVTKGAYKDAYNCIQMSIAMQKSMDELNDKWLTHGIKRNIQIRVGINSGYCHVGNIGSSQRLAYTVIGRVVNIAARIESLAEPGSVYIAQETFNLVNNKVEAIYKGHKKLKGISHEVAVYDVMHFTEVSHNEVLYIDDSKITISGVSRDRVDSIIKALEDLKVD